MNTFFNVGDVVHLVSNRNNPTKIKKIVEDMYYVVEEPYFVYFLTDFVEFIEQFHHSNSEYLKDLSGIKLAGCRFKNMLLKNISFCGADLSNVTFLCCDLEDVDFSNAKMAGTVFNRCNFNKVNFTDADPMDLIALCDENIIKNVQCPMICPETGSFIAYKKAFSNRDYEYPVIVKLEVPEDALRSSGFSRKCRCSKAKVLSITNKDGSIHYASSISIHDWNFQYHVGEIVEADGFDIDRWQECASGIHFFMTREEAVAYYL